MKKPRLRRWRLSVTTLLFLGIGLGEGSALAAPDLGPTGIVDRLSNEIARFRSYPHFDRAYRLVRHGKDREALAEFEQGLAHEPRDTSARLAWADALARLGQNDLALRQIDTALTLAPGHAGAMRRRAVLWLNRGQVPEAQGQLRALLVNASASTEDRDFAKSLLAGISASAAADAPGHREPLAASASPDWQALLDAARDHESNGRFDEAEKGYARAMALAPDAAVRLNILSIRLRNARRRGDLGGQRALLLQSVELAPDNRVVLVDLINLSMRTRDKRATKTWLSALGATSRTAADFEELGNLRYASGDAPMAAEAYRQGLLRTQDRASRWRMLTARGHALQAAGERDVACRSFADATGLNPTAEALRASANCLLASGDVAAAIQPSRRVAALSGRPADRVMLAGLLASAGQDAEAIEQAREGLAGATDRTTRFRALRLIAFSQLKAGDFAAARDALDQVVQVAPDEPESQLALAHAWAGLGDDRAAADHYEISIRLRPSLGAYRGLVASRSHLGDAAGSVAAYRGLLNQPDLAPADAAVAQASVGDLLLAQGQVAAASNAYRAALEGGLDTPALHLGLGYALMGMNQTTAAIDEFKSAHAAAPRSGAALQLARTYMALNRTDEALRYGQAALADSSELRPEQLAVLLQEMSTLYLGIGRADQAVTLRQRASTLDPGPSSALSLAEAQLANDQLDAAQQSLDSWPEDAWAAPLIAQRLDLASEIQARGRHPAAARALLRRAVAHDSTARRLYRLAMLDIELGQTQEGLRLLDAAIDAQPEGSLREEGALALYEGRHFADAATLYQRALAQAPDRIDLRRGFAYALMRDGRNEEAEEQFRATIDQSLLAATDYTEANELDIARLRREVRKLDKDFNFSFYENYRTHTHETAQGAAGVSVSAGGVVPSQGGAEAAWRLPGIGLVDDRTLEVFGRTTWSHRQQSLAVEPRSAQLSAGLRYKPLSSQQFYLGAERLIKAGSDSSNDWLFRASYGWTDGLGGDEPHASSWNYSSFYSDLGRFTGQKITAVYFEGRQGRTWRIGEHVVMSPHLVVDGRFQRPGGAVWSYSEAGAGVSLRGALNSTAQEAARSSAELLLQYKVGLKRIGNGWSLTAVLAF